MNNFDTLIAQLKNSIEIKKINDSQVEILTGAKINNQKISVYLKEEAGTIRLSDNKNTLRYMSNLYELKSPDVKNCIGSVIKIYGFSIASGELIANIKSENAFMETFYNFILCIGQLANMYAFFDNPQ